MQGLGIRSSGGLVFRVLGPGCWSRGEHKGLGFDG